MSEQKPPHVSNVRQGGTQGAGTPSTHATQAARKEFEVIDSTGRKITLRKPSVLAQYDAIGLVDDRRPGAGAQRLMAGMLLYVAAINGEEVPAPTTERELRAIFQQLGDEGYMAVAGGIEAHFPAAKKKPEQENALKNS